MKIVAIASGGMDSATLLYKLRADGHEVIALGINYGQRHRRELEFLAQLCQGDLDIPHRVADLSSLRPLIAGESSQVNPDVAVPHGHYADDTMKTTVVPNRNMIMLSVAIGHAISEKADAVAYGAHAGDHTIYPDCRASFAATMEAAALLCDWRPIRLVRPFVHITKADIAKLGAILGVPYQLTWSCYEGREVHCGKCGTCVERREAFELAEISDPTEYAA